MDSKEDKLHIVMVPWLAFGHIIPFLELAKLVAQKGHQISFISTPRNIHRLPKLPPNLVPLIKLVELPLPHVDNLPKNAEATTDIPLNKHPYLKKAFDGLQEPVTRFLETSDPDWIIYDLAYWVCPIAAKLSISCAFFSVFNAWTLSFVGSTSTAVIDGGGPPSVLKKLDQSTGSSKCAPFSTTVVFQAHETMGGFKIPIEEDNDSELFRFCSAIRGCDVFLVRSCLELEPYWLNRFEELHRKPVVPVGLLPPMVQDSKDDDMFLPISEWLDKHDKESAVYVALGSEVRPSQAEFIELAFGLELSGLPFFWALRKQAGSDESDSIELPDGFEDRVKGHGIVWTSWAPQLRILGHESVGGFLTHCGWSSIIEGLQLGHPLIMLPLWGDQGMNAKVMEENEVGLRIARDDSEQYGPFTRNSVAESLGLVMVEEDGKRYREKAKEMMKIFGDKERHDQYADGFVEYCKIHRPVPKGTSTPLHK